jgi:hypothetical protein
MSAFGESAFLRRLKSNAEGSNKPKVPGQIRVSRAVSDEFAAKVPPEAGGSVKSKPEEATAVSEASDIASPERGKYVSTYRQSQFDQLLANENVDLGALRRLAWNGIPPKHRPEVWQMLLGYLPTNRDRRAAALNRKRKEYFDSIDTYFSVSEMDRTKQDEDNHGQILIDLPRTSPDVAFFQQPLVQRAMQRILYVWSIRHPASGYVQGMNDLLTPLLLVSVMPYADDPLRCDVAALEAGVMVSAAAAAAAADC